MIFMQNGFSKTVLNQHSALLCRGCWRLFTARAVDSHSVESMPLHLSRCTVCRFQPSPALDAALAEVSRDASATARSPDRVGDATRGRSPFWPVRGPGAATWRAAGAGPAQPPPAPAASRPDLGPEGRRGPGRRRRPAAASPASPLARARRQGCRKAPPRSRYLPGSCGPRCRVIRIHSDLHANAPENALDVQQVVCAESNYWKWSGTPFWFQDLPDAADLSDDRENWWHSKRHPCVSSLSIRDAWLVLGYGWATLVLISSQIWQIFTWPRCSFSYLMYK